MSVESVKREVAARFTAAGLPGAARAVLSARLGPDGRLLCGGLGMYDSATYAGSTVPQAPRNRVPEGPDDWIRRALHAAASPSLRTVPAPLRIPGVTLPGVEDAQPWRQLPPAVESPWKVVQLRPEPPLVQIARHPMSIPAAVQHPVYQQRAEQVVPRPGLSGLDALLPADPAYATVRQTVEGWPGLRDLMEEVRVAHGPAAAVAFATAAMTDPEAQRLRAALAREVEQVKSRRGWEYPGAKIRGAESIHVQTLHTLLRARMQAVGSKASGKLSYREVQGKGGYVYQQRPDGTIYILQSPRGPGGQVQTGSAAWRAITEEIGPYRAAPKLLSGLAAPPPWAPPRGVPPFPRPMPIPHRAPPGAPGAVPLEVHLHRVLVRVGLAAAGAVPEGLLQQLADDAVRIETAAARGLGVPAVGPAVVARRRAAIVAELRAPRALCG